MPARHFDEYLSPELDDTIKKVLRDTLPHVKNIEDIPNQIDRMVKMIEGQEGFMGVIARAHNYTLEGKRFIEQIDELSKEKIIPRDIADDLHFLRKRYNISKHEKEIWKNLKISDVKTVRDSILRIVEWFYCECPMGPHHESIFVPKKLVTVLIGHERTLIAKASINRSKVEQISNYRTLLSNSFFTPKGFDAFCCLLDQYQLNDPCEGISIGVAAEVAVDGMLRGWFVKMGWPERMLKTINDRYPNTKIALINDAVAYATGVDLSELALPTLALTVGNGVGCALIEEDHIDAKELERLIVESNNIHSYLGFDFFAKEAPRMKWDYVDMRNTLSQRLAKAIIKLREKYEFKSVVVGGGRSVFYDENIVNASLEKARINLSVQAEDDIFIKGLAQHWNKAYQESLK